MFSVCIISNKVDPLLEKVLGSVSGLTDEIWIAVPPGIESDAKLLRQKFSNVQLCITPWLGYGATKNLLASKPRRDWVLSLDADEVADKKLSLSLKNLKPEEGKIYLLKRVNFVGDKKILHGDFSPELKPRLYNRHQAKWSMDAVHEVLETGHGSRQQLLDGELLHYTSPNLQAVAEKNDHYAKLSAGNMLQKNKQAGVLKKALSPPAAFVRQYIFKKGFLDGKMGLLLALEMTRYTKMKYRILEELRQKKSRG